MTFATTSSCVKKVPDAARKEYTVFMYRMVLLRFYYVSVTAAVLLLLHQLAVAAGHLTLRVVYERRERERKK